MSNVEKLSKELNFQPGDALTVEQMTVLLGKRLDNENLMQVAAVVKNFAPVASAALNGMANTAIAAAKVDEAVCGAMKQAIIELGKFHADESVAIREEAIKQIRRITDQLSDIAKDASSRSSNATAAISLVAMAFIGLLMKGRGRIV